MSSQHGQRFGKPSSRRMSVDSLTFHNQTFPPGRELPRFLFRIFTPNSGRTGRPKVPPLNTPEYITPMMFAHLIKSASSDLIHSQQTPNIRQSIQRHLTGETFSIDNNIRTPFRSRWSSWTASFNFIVSFAYYALRNPNNIGEAFLDPSKIWIAAIDTQICSNPIHHSSEFPGQERISYPEEYLIQGVIRGPAYTCKSFADWIAVGFPAESSVNGGVYGYKSVKKEWLLDELKGPVYCSEREENYSIAVAKLYQTDASPELPVVIFVGLLNLRERFNLLNSKDEPTTELEKGLKGLDFQEKSNISVAVGGDAKSGEGNTNNPQGNGYGGGWEHLYRQATKMEDRLKAEGIISTTSPSMQGKIVVPAKSQRCELDMDVWQYFNYLRILARLDQMVRH